MTALGTSVWLDPPDGQRWRFDPGSLSLAFGYTGDFRYDVPAWEMLRSSAELDAWLSERFGPLVHPSDEADYAGARQLRAGITSSARRVAVGHLLNPNDVDTINVWASQPPIAPHLEGGNRPADAPLPAQALATIAQDAIATFTLTAGNLRECAADDCRLIFFDTFRPQTRRWCSMNRCGGRAKSQSHYPRHSTAAP